MAHVDDIKRYLLGAIAGTVDRPLDAGQVGTSSAAFAEPDWQTLGDMVSQHRLGSLLHWRLQQGDEFQVPDEVRQTWARDYQRQSLRSLALQRELVLLRDRLAAWEVPGIFLKGSYLAFHVYPQAGMRPLRDIDILIPSDHLEFVYAGLLAAGYTGTELAMVDFAASHKHLPGLVSPFTGVNIELHRRLTSPKHAGALQATLDEAGLWARHIDAEIAGRSLSFLAPTDLLLHLIVHGVYDHRFDNGPLLFADIHFLCARHQIDWALFWQQAEQGGWQKGCRLALALTDLLFGGVSGGEHVVAAPIPRASLDDALLLSLRDFKQRQAVYLQLLLSELPRHDSRLATLWRVCFPSAKVMQVMYERRASGLGLAWLYLHRLFFRAKRWVTGKSNAALRREAQQIARLEAWLGVSAQSEH